MKMILNGIIKENPVFVLMLGLCSTLAVTTTFEQSYMMGLCVLFVLTMSNTIVSLIRSLIPENVQTPVYIVLIGTLVTILEILLKNYVPTLYESFGIYLALIVVNCIVLGRAIQVASKNSVKKSFLDGIGCGLGYTVALMIIGTIREVIGNNTITIMDKISSLSGTKVIINILPENDMLPIQFLTTPAGAFLTLGLLLALFQYLQNRKGVNKS